MPRPRNARVSPETPPDGAVHVERLAVASVTARSHSSRTTAELPHTLQFRYTALTLYRL